MLESDYFSLIQLEVLDNEDDDTFSTSFTGTDQERDDLTYLRTKTIESSNHMKMISKRLAREIQVAATLLHLHNDAPIHMAAMTEQDHSLKTINTMTFNSWEPPISKDLCFRNTCCRSDLTTREQNTSIVRNTKQPPKTKLTTTKNSGSGTRMKPNTALPQQMLTIRVGSLKKISDDCRRYSVVF
mmetsp:Transcript_7705/g.19193  ORF Transcript_7705/g.19193 Transcript_7705/m.19193 type:complete len:185 (-) Transcript_7705:232-786(-)